MAVVERPYERVGPRRGENAVTRWLFNQPAGRLLILPALLYAILVTQAPFLLTLWYSLWRWNTLRPENKAFIWFNNYKSILTDDDRFRTAIGNTVLMTAGAVLISLLVGLIYAELVNHRFPGRGVVRTMLITPFLVMPVAGALGWKNMMLNPDYGLVDWVLRHFGAGKIDWIADYPKGAIIAILVWRWAPFMMLILLAGMQSISEEVREAARVDGANAWQEFRSITLPHLSRFLQLGGLLGTVYIVQEFDAIFMTTKGGPGTASLTLSYEVYRRAFEAHNIGSASALGVVVVLMTIVVMTLLLRVLDRLLRE